MAEIATKTYQNHEDLAMGLSVSSGQEPAAKQPSIHVNPDFLTTGWWAKSEVAPHPIQIRLEIRNYNWLVVTGT